jgi:hypothetical protein
MRAQELSRRDTAGVEILPCRAKVLNRGLPAGCGNKVIDRGGGLRARPGG